MKLKTKRLLEQALSLSSEEKEDLVKHLWTSLDEREWLNEVESRVDDLESGRVKPIPIRKAFASLEKTLHGTSRKRRHAAKRTS